MSTATKDTAIVLPPEAQRSAPRALALTVSPDASSLMKIIDRAAMDPSFDVAKLQQLLAVKKEWDQDEARKAFVAAMAQFKADPPTILKGKAVNIPGGARFSHATLAAVCDGVIAALSQHGFSHKWEIVQQGRDITVTCIVTHQLGHQERTTLTGAPDDSGKKNAIQQVASTVTYLQRYTLLAATGLAAKDMDDDGNGAGGGGSGGASAMEPKVLLDHLAAIDAAADATSLNRSFGLAWNAAEEIKDKAAQAKLIDHRDARRKALRVR